MIACGLDSAPCVSPFPTSSLRISRKPSAICPCINFWCCTVAYASGTGQQGEWVLISHNREEPQRTMWNYVGIVRSDLRLTRALRRTRLLYEEVEEFYHRTRISSRLCELRNLIAVAYLIIRSAQMRRESRGLHYTLDYPEQVTAERRASLV